MSMSMPQRTVSIFKKRFLKECKGCPYLKCQASIFCSSKLYTCYHLQKPMGNYVICQIVQPNYFRMQQQVSAGYWQPSRDTTLPHISEPYSHYSFYTFDSLPGYIHFIEVHYVCTSPSSYYCHFSFIYSLKYRPYCDTCMEALIEWRNVWYRIRQVWPVLPICFSMYVWSGYNTENNNPWWKVNSID